MPSKTDKQGHILFEVWNTAVANKYLLKGVGKFIWLVFTHALIAS